MCKQIDHFPEDADYEADASEYFLRESNLIILYFLSVLFLLLMLYFELKLLCFLLNISKHKSYSYGQS